MTEVACDMESTLASSLGGDGSSKLKASAGCAELRDFFGKVAKDNGKFWIADASDDGKSAGQEECDFDNVEDAKIVEKAM